MSKSKKQDISTEIEKINKEILKIFKDDIEWVKYEKNVIYPFWKKNVAPINPEGVIVDEMFEEWANEMKKRVSKGKTPTVKPKHYDMDASGDVKTKLDFSKYNNPEIKMECDAEDQQMMIELINAQEPTEFGSHNRVQEEWMRIYDMGKSLMELAQNKLTDIGVILESSERDQMPSNLDECSMEESDEAEEECIEDSQEDEESDDEKGANWHASKNK